MNSTVINIFASFATLLAGDPTDCFDPTDTSDASCVGGVAAVAAVMRHSQNRGDGPSLHIPQLDRGTKFVQMHPLGWGVNHKILHERFNWPAYITSPSLVADSMRDVSLLKTHSFAPIITNSDVPSTNKWRPYLHNVYFDTGTSTAYIHVGPDKQPLMAPAEESLRLALDYVAELNEQNGCFDITDTGESTLAPSNKSVSSQCAATLSTSTCWSPIVYYTMRDPNQYASCLKVALEHEHPPLVFYEQFQNAERGGNADIINGTTVVFSMGGDDEIVGHLRIDLGDYQVVDNRNNQGKAQRWRTIKSMNFNVTNLKHLPLELKDEDYVSDLQYLRTLADEAIDNDPVVGTSEEMPITTVDDRRMCMGGECPLGNLFTDAMQWKTKTDFAVFSSGGMRGLGWPAGNVTVGDLWAALPFMNYVCTGTMTGVSIVRMLNYSTAVSTFESTYTPMGDRLLQMSGMKMTYNTLVSGEGPGRLMSVEVYDRETKSYQPIERLKLYTFTSDDWMCNGFDPYPSFLGSELRIKGEAAGVVDDEMGGLQQIVGDFLTHLNGAYDTSLQGRLANDTAAFEPMDFIQSASSCPPPSYWDEEYATCFAGELSESSDSNTSMIIGIAVGVLALMFTVFAVLDYSKKQKIKDQQELLKSATLEIKKRDAELKAFSIGTSKYGDAVSFVDTLLDREIDEDEMEKLALVKSCLIKGDDTEMYIPDNLGDTSAEEAYILQNFAGVKTCSGVYIASMTNVASAARGVNSTANSFLANKRERESGSRRGRASTRNFISISNASLLNITKDPSDNAVQSIECIPEFTRLEASQQRKLFELLSFSNLKRWDFNVFQIADVDEENTLLFVAWAVICSPYSQIAMAKQLGLVGREEAKVPGSLDLNDFDGNNFFDMDLDIDDEKLCGYIRAIQGDYQNVPYHNRVHAADVVQTLNSLILMADKSMSFQKEDLFLLLIASVIHDVKHPGRNNAFQVNAFSDLSLVHNDQSVLENEHASHAFKLLIHGDHHFLHNVKPSKFAELRKKIVQAVLHTDMTSHFATVAKIKSNAAGKLWGELDSDMQWEVLMYMLHMADISNPAKGDPMFRLWTDRCLEEFFAQGDKEKEMGLVVSMLCDRNTTKKPDSQIGFINFVVKPAYEVLAGVIPAVGKKVLPVIESNIVYWKKEKDLEVIVEDSDAEENV